MTTSLSPVRIVIVGVTAAVRSASAFGALLIAPSSRPLTRYSRIDIEVSPFLMGPSKLLFDPGPAKPAKLGAADRIVHHVDDRPCIFADIIWSHVHCRVSCRYSRLTQVESHN